MKANRLALLAMKDWHGLYGFSLKKDFAIKELLSRGYELRREAPGLTRAQVKAAGLAKGPSPKERKPYKTGLVTLQSAADLCQVSKSTIQKWENGRAPEGWPGRSDAVELKKFSVLYRSRKETARIISKANNPVLVDPARLQNAARSAFDDDDD